MSKIVFHTIRSIGVFGKNKLCAQFDCGIIKTYNILPISKKYPVFENLVNNEKLFRKVKIDEGGYGIIWNKEIDLSSEEIWINGKTIGTKFDNLYSFSDASKIWDIEESTLRKAVSYGKLTPGIDCCKFGKQWVVCRDAMIREYGSKEQEQLQDEDFLLAADNELKYGIKK